MEKLPKRIDLIKRLAPGALVAEVGVWRGYFSTEILNETRVGKLFLVDAWKRQVWSKHEQQSDAQHEKDLAECKHHIRGHLASGRVQIVRGTSAEVALHDRTIPPLDAVFIDACHEYDFVTEDLINWSKRLKPDGVLMGHDFTDTHPNAIKWGFGVVPAVKDFCAKYGWEIVATTEEDFPSYELRRALETDESHHRDPLVGEQLGQAAPGSPQSMIPKIIHTCLMGGYKPSAIGERCMESWRRVLPDYEIRIWNDANIPRSEWAKAAISERPVNASHWAQWRSLLDHGGVFLDIDVEVIRAFDLEAVVFTGFQRADSEECCINNAIVGAVPGHPFVRRILNRIESSDPGGWPLITGPGILTDVLRENGLRGLNTEQKVGDVTVYDRERFYPWFYTEPAIPRELLSERTFACHLWEGSWNK